MDLKDLDLNLLVVFNELQKHGRVAVVAQSLGISQPGVSNALGRLRKLLATSCSCVPRAAWCPRPTRNRWPGPSPTRWARCSTLNARASFDPRGSERGFVIGVNDVGESISCPG